jgi:hypothetical protein
MHHSPEIVGSATAPSEVEDELQALASVGRAIAPLTNDAAERVLAYFLDRLGRSRTKIDSSINQAIQAGTGRESEYVDFATLYDATNPRTGAERALIAAYWHQEILRNDDWDSQSINTELKNLGHGSANITADLRTLSERNPRLALQVRKGGPSRQARKRYKLTREGVKSVQAMISQG